jgi:3-oxoacyl-(acyl-carrier-protein) synthase/NADP-dependent 3-hydroxy acid dehydrogenase YdfG/acyl carrier protein
MDIAIIGLSGKFPLAENIAEFHNNLRTGMDCVRDISQKRMSDTTIPIKKYRKLAFIEDIDKFDPNFFGYSSGEAELMDPHQRIALEVVYHAIENAGYSLKDFNHSRTSLYFASPDLLYYRHFEKLVPAALLGNVTGVTPGVISRYFNLIGPATLINTTCSSSLVSVHYACRDLIDEECDYSIVCAVNLSLFPFEDALIPNVGISAPDGKAKAFDAAADGTGGGEFAGCILLKPLQKAIADHDLIHAVIKGTAINQDGKRSSFLASPSKVAQEEVITNAWRKAGIPAESVQYVEAHGTGTRIGDPIEVDGINNAFRRHTDRKQFCAISSVKTNIGHTNMAAGIAGLVKAVLSIKHKELFPSLHFKRPNPFIDFENGAVYVNGAFQQWKNVGPEPRRCGVSAFGLCGTNAHVVLEESPITPQYDLESNDYLFPISANSNGSLVSNIENLLDFVERNGGVDLGSLSYTLFARSSFKHRAGVIAGDTKLLAEKLKVALHEKQVHATLQVLSHVTLFITDQGNFNVHHIHEDILQIPSYARTYESFLATMRDLKIVDSNVVRYFVHVCCTARLLTTAGVPLTKYRGVGVGAVAAKALSGRFSETEALQLLASFIEDTDATESTKHDNLINDTLDECVLIMEHHSTQNIHEAPSPFGLMAIRGWIDSRNSYLQILKKFYELGLALQWDNNSTNRRVLKIDLPSYSFEKTRIWIKPKAVTEKSYGHYHLHWKKHDITPASSKNVLSVAIISNSLNYDNILEKELAQQGHRCISFCGRSYQLDNIGTELINHRIDTIIFLCSNDTHQWTSGVEMPIAEGLKDLHDLFNILKILVAKNTFNRLNLISITFKGRRILEDDYVNPYASMIHGFLTSLQKEVAWLRVKSVDVDSLSQQSARRISRDLTPGDDIVPVIGYRGNDRYVLSIIENTSDHEERLGRSLPLNGNFLVTGGGSGIGLELVRQLAQDGQRNLLIVGRSPAPQDLLHSNEFTGDAIKRSGIMYLQVDVSDAAALAEACNKFVAIYGPINGVIHAAGVAGNATFSKHTWQTFQSTLFSKVHGSVNILRQFQGNKDCHFIVLFSGLAAYIGAAGNTNYSAGNIFLDNVIHNYNRSEGRIKARTISWPAWSDAGIYFRWKNKHAQSQQFYEEEGYTLSSAEGIEAFLETPVTGDGLSLIYQAGYTSFPIDRYQASGPAPAHPQILRKLHRSHQEIEEIVAASWKKVLKTDVLNHETDFFELGSTSLHFTTVINSIREEIGIELEFDEIDSNSTIKRLATHIQTRLPEAVFRANDFGPIESQEYYSPSFQQLGILAQEAANKSLTAYNMAGTFELTGKLDERALQDALTILLEEHEVLRSAFFWLDNFKVKFTPINQFDLRLQINDLRDIQDRDLRCKDLIEKVINTPFGLEEAPLVRTQLIRVEEEKHLFTICFHHLVGDAWSIELLTNQLIYYYDCLSKATAPTKYMRQTHYKDYAARQSFLMEEGEFETAKKYWLRTLKDNCPVLSLPTSKPRPKFKTYNGDYVLSQIPPAVSADIAKLRTDLDTTDFAVFTSLTYILLYRYSGQNNIVTGTRTAGRNDKKLENQIGFYVNTFVLRLDIYPDDSLLNIIKKLKDYLSDGFKYQYYPFNQLISDVAFKRDPARSPIFDVLIEMINIESVVSENASLQNIQVKSLPATTKTSKYDLCFRFKQSSESSFLILEYNTDLYERTYIETMIMRFNTILEQSLKAPETTVQQIHFSDEGQNQADENLIDIFNQNF